MKHFIIALMVLCTLGLTSSRVWAQTKATSTVKSTPPTGAECSKLYESPPHPTYKDGGIDGMFRSIAKNVQYPKGQTRNGNVYVNLLVTKAGDVSNVKIQKGLGKPFDAEALRVVRLLGKWIPTGKDQNPDHDLFTIPVTFTYSPAHSQPKKP